MVIFDNFVQKIFKGMMSDLKKSLEVSKKKFSESDRNFFKNAASKVSSLADDLVLLTM